jgi:phosphatidyl-myo-inositol alpha-mannosyltransferase
VRVAVVAPVFRPEARGEPERFAHGLASGLAAAGHRAVIVTSAPGRPGRACEEGVPVVRVPRAPDGPLRRRLYEDHLTTVPGLWAAVRRERPDAVVATHATAALAAGDLPLVYAFTGVPHRASLGARRGRLALVTRAIDRAGAVTALSEHAAGVFRDELGVEARVVAPGVDLETFSPGGGRAPEPTIVCVADAREPHRRVGLLVEAFGFVREVLPTARLVLDRRSAVAAGVRGPGVELAAMDDTAALVALNRRAWAAALPGRGEASGLALAEALACGTPVVGANRGGVPELLGDEPVGGLFDGDDPIALAAALLATVRLGAEPGTAAACRARAERFSRERSAAAYAALLAEVSAAPGGAGAAGSRG